MNFEQRKEGRKEEERWRKKRFQTTEKQTEKNENRGRSTKEGAPYAARFNVLVLNGRHPASPGGSRASAVETSC